MPATAGRVRMPANNRVHSSAALQTHSIWENTIKHNPYAPKKDIDNSDSDSKTTGKPYTNFQDLIKLAQITASNPDDESRGACKRCGRLGHLSFQCRNFLTTKYVKEKEQDLSQRKPLLSAVVEKVKEESESDESETSDSEVDSEIERIIAQRCGNGNGKKKSSKRRSSSRKKDVSGDSDSDSRGRKRGKSKKHRSQKKMGRSDSESEDDEAKRKRRKKRKRSNKEKEEVVKP